MREAGGLNLLELSLRLFVIPLSVVSICFMVLDKEANNDYGSIRYSDISGLKYLVFLDAITGGYALVSLVLERICVTKIWIFYLTDQLLAYLMVTSFSSVADFLYLAYNGDREVSWSEACSYYGKFCGRAAASFAFHVMILLCLCTLSPLSAYRYFSRFEAPSSP